MKLNKYQDFMEEFVCLKVKKGIVKENKPS